MIDRNFMIWIFGELLFSYTETQHLEDFKVYKFQHPNFRDEVEKSGPEVVSWLRWHSNQQKARTRSHALAFWPRAFSLLWCFEFQEANQWMQCCIYICKHFLLFFNFLSVSTRRYKRKTFNFSIPSTFFNLGQPCVIIMEQTISASV